MISARRRLRRPDLLVVGLVLAVLITEGLASVRIGYPSFDFRNAVFVLLTGLIVGGTGLLAWMRMPESRTGPILVAAAGAWYIGGFRWVAYEPVAQVAQAFDLLFAAVVAHALLTYPTGRSESAAWTTAIVAAYGASLAPLPRAELLVAIVLLLALAGGCLRHPATRAVRAPAVTAGVGFALVLGGYQLLPASVGGLGWLDTRPLLQLALITSALMLAIPLIRSRGRADRVADVATELAISPGVRLARELGEVVGDPSARLGFWDAQEHRYIDSQGRPLTAAETQDRALAIIEVDGRPRAAIEHARNVRIDEHSLAALARAAEISAVNARLQAEVRDQVLDVRASRRRLLVASEDERFILEQELFASLDPQLDILEAVLTDSRLLHDDAARAALDQVRQTRVEIRSLVRGWGPAMRDDPDVSAALREVAAQVKIPVHLHLDDVTISSPIARSTLVFVASEALANVVKHAHATGITIRLAGLPDALRLEVVDDGRGGADVARGTGLLGLRDRIDAINGKLMIDSRPGQGTRLMVDLPRNEAITP